MAGTKKKKTTKPITENTQQAIGAAAADIANAKNDINHVEDQTLKNTDRITEVEKTTAKHEVMLTGLKDGQEKIIKQLEPLSQHAANGKKGRRVHLAWQFVIVLGALFVFIVACAIAAKIFGFDVIELFMILRDSAERYNWRVKVNGSKIKTVIYSVVSTIVCLCWDCCCFVLWGHTLRTRKKDTCFPSIN